MKRLLVLLICAMLLFTGYVYATTNTSAGTNKKAATKTVNTAAQKKAVNIINILTKAKSARSFTKSPVLAKDLDVILKAGINAPSAYNKQPWHFSVVKDAAILNKIASNNQPTQQVKLPWLTLPDATVAIIISGTNDPFSCGLACQNMSIAAMTLGYATKIVNSPAAIINGNNKDYFHKLLGIPKDMNAVAVLLIGASKENVDAISGATTRKSFNDAVTYVTNK